MGARTHTHSSVHKCPPLDGSTPRATHTSTQCPWRSRGRDTFGEVFLAGISIAFAAVGATVFLGIIVRGRYDDIEKSFFEAQDEALAQDQEAASGRAVIDFFGDSAADELPTATMVDPEPSKPSNDVRS